MTSNADAIVLLDRSGSDTIDIASGFQGGGTTFTLTLADGQRLYSFNGGDTINIGGGAPANFLLTGIQAGNLANPFSGSGAPVLTTTRGGFNTVSLANGNLLQGVVIANGPGGFAVTGTGIAGLTITNSSLGGLSLTTATGTATVTNSTLSHLAISGGSINFSGTKAHLANSANVAAVSISGGHTGSVGFDALSSVIATVGTGLQFDNADGVYTFNGTTTLNGGDAGIDILNGSGGSFLFGVGTSITSPSGTAFNLQSSTANVTYNGTITQHNAATAVQAANNTGGTLTFGGLVTANTSTAGAVVLTGNGGATVSFLGGLDIDTTTGTGLSATGGGTINIAATAGNETINSTSGQATNLANVTVGITLDSVAAAGAARGIGLDTVGGSFTVSGITAIDDVTADGIFIQNSSVNATFGGRVSIRNDGVGANGDGVDLLTNTGAYAFNGGVDITVNGAGAFGFRAQSSGTVNILDPNGTNQITSNNGTALFVNPTVINMTLANLTAANGANGISLSGASGSLSITGAVNISNTTAAGISIANSTSAFAATFGGAVVVNNVASVGGGVSATGNTAGALSFNGGLDIDTTSGAGFTATGGGTFTVTGAGNSISTGTGMALSMNGVTVGAPGMSFASTNKGSGGTSAVVMSSVSGTGTINLGTGTIVGGSGPAIRIGDGAGGANTGGTAGLTYAGTITNTTAAGSTGRAVDIQDRAAGAQNITLSGAITHNVAGQTGIFLDDNAAGSITFSGGSKAITSGTANAVNLTDNAGATINFTNGGLVINTTTGIGFNAAGAGPAATTGGTVTVQGAGNMITSTTGTALNVANTTIGASGLTLQSINANGGANGIVFNNTGTSGGLTITGIGTTDGSGGTIQNTTGRGASFISASNITLKNMNFTNAGTSDLDADNSGLSIGDNLATNAAIHLQSVTTATLDNLNISGGAEQGINGNNVSNFTLSNSALSGIGNGPDEDGIHFFNMSGTSAITNTTIASSGSNGLNLQMQSGTLNLTISGGSSTNNVLGSGYLFGIRGTSNATINFSGANSSTNFSGGIVADAFDFSTMNLSVINSTSSGNNDQLSVSAGDNSRVDLVATGNTLSSVAAGDFGAINLLGSAFDNGYVFDANISGNTITTANGLTADGISVFNAGGGDMRVAITNNTIDYAGAQRAILIQAGQDGNGSTRARIAGNAIDIKLDGAGNAATGILVQTAITGPGNTSSIDLSIGGAGALANTFTHSLGGSIASGDIRVRQRDDGTINLDGYVGGATDLVAVIGYLDGRNSVVSSSTASAATGFTGNVTPSFP